MQKIYIKENNINDAVKVLSIISEFGGSYSKESLQKELGNNKFLIIVGYVGESPVGCLIGFDRFHDGSFYCWLVGVDPVFRGLDIMLLLMEYQEKWAKSNNYKILRIKTRNDSRAMLNYLIKNNFNIIDVRSPKNPKESIVKRYLNLVIIKTISILNRFLKFESTDAKENRIMLEKHL